MSLALSYFIIMMRKFKIFTTWVNIYSTWDYIRTHYRAFDMPTWASYSPRRFILRFVFFRFFPKSKILSISLFIKKFIILFIFILNLPFIFNYLFLYLQLRINKSIIFLISINIKINWSIRFISKTIRDNFLYKFNYFWNKLSYSSNNIRWINF